MCKRPWQLLRRCISSFHQAHAASHAASLTLSTLLSSIPLFLLTTLLLNWLHHQTTLGPSIEHAVMNHFVTESLQPVTHYVQTLLSQPIPFQASTVFFLILSTLLLLYNLLVTINTIWQQPTNLSFLLALVLYFSLLLFAPLIASLLLILTSIFIWPALSGSWAQLAPYAAELLVFFLINWLAPSTRVNPRHAFIASAVTTLLFEAGKWLFQQYSIVNDSYTVIYGPIAIWPLSLIWIYSAWMIILFGITLCHQLQQSTSRISD